MEKLAVPSTLKIDDSVRELAVAYAERFIGLEQKYLKLKLDFTFPSIGLVELSLTHLRGINSLSLQEEQLVRGAAAYLAFIAAHAWASVPDELTISAALETTGGIKITARGGAFLKDGSTFSVDILSGLKAALRDQSLEFFASLSREIGDRDTPVELFAIGLFSGLCPSGIGNWKSLTAKEFSVYIEQIEKFLARTCSQYFDSVYIDHDFQDLPEIFANSLTLPPHGFDEPFMGLRAASLLIEHLNREGYSDQATLDFARKLSAIPTRQLSMVGQILQLSLTEEVRVGETIIDPRIRPAVCGIRNKLFGEIDWLSSLENSPSESLEAKEKIQDSFERELHQGLLPHINLPGRLIFSSRFHPLLKALAWGELELAKNGCDALLESPSVDDFSLLLQKIYLSIELGDLQSATEDLSLATLALSNASIDQSITYFQLGGDLHFRLGDYENAIEYLTRGLEQGSFRSFDTLPSLYLQTLIAQGRLDEAIRAGNQLKERFPCSANIDLPLAVAALQTDDLALGGEYIAKVLWNDPNNQIGFWVALRAGK